MLTVPPLVLKAIKQAKPDKATSQDIATIRSLVDLAVPESYLEFIRTHGYLEPDSLDDPSCFAYTYREPELQQEFRGDISHFMDADTIATYYQNLVLDPDADDVPKFPAFFLPIGLDSEQSCILLECGGEKDRIWFWEFQAEPWGQGDNVRLGFVADSFEGFLKALYICDD